MFVKVLILSLLLLLGIVPINAQQNQNGPALILSSQSWLDRHELKKEWKEPQRLIVYEASGRQRKEQRGRQMSPKLVIDSVRFSNGVGVLTLNSEVSRANIRLVARSADDIHLLNAYGVTIDSTIISRTFDSIKVYSGSAPDTTVQVTVMVQ